MSLKRIKPSEKDHKILENTLATRKITENGKPRNYKNCVVMKPWGYEYLIFENEHIAIWLLRVNDRHSTSMHCHPLKKTALILLSGEAFCNTFRHRNYLTALSGLILEKRVFHSTKALSSGGIELLEVETPPDKTNIIRFLDAYGRKNLDYEAFSEIKTQDLRRFNHFYFEESLGRGEQTHFAEHYCISLETFFDNNHFQNTFNPCEKEIYTVCRGQIVNSNGMVMFDVGDISLGSDLRKSDSIKITEKMVLLKAREKSYENH